MMLVVSPVLVPMATAMLCGLSSSSRRWQSRISMLGALALLGCALALLNQVQISGTLSLAAGDWPLPFSIEMAADRLGAALVVLAALMLTVVLLWQGSDVDNAPQTSVLYPLLHGLVAGACGAFLTADLFNLYVWFEVTLICALGLLAQGGALRQLDATLKYFALNLFGTLLLLAAIALLYSTTGQLNFSALADAPTVSKEPVMLPLIGLLMLAFLVKAAAFPFFAWLPASYHTLPVPVLALFSALLSKIGICALLRMLVGVFHPAPEPLYALLGWIALLSMVVGVLGAAYHWDLRRILAFHSVSQIGYILLAMSLASLAGDAAAVFFALHHSLVKAGLFLCAALIFRHTGHYDLRKIGGLYAVRPVLALMFLLLALSLVGIPPFSGFWGKYLVVRACIVQGEYIWAGVALVVGALTFYSMLKIWMEAFWKNHPDTGWTPPQRTRSTAAYSGAAILLLVVLWLGLFPQPAMVFVTEAAEILHEGLP